MEGIQRICYLHIWCKKHSISYVCYTIFQIVINKNDDIINSKTENIFNN